MKDSIEVVLERSNLEACERCRRLTAEPGAGLCSRCSAVIHAIQFQS